MADLNIPNLNNRSDKYIFKKKLTLRRKSKKRLITEAFVMSLFASLLVYINNLIPNKNLLLQNFPITLNKFFKLFFDLLFQMSEIFLVFFILISALLSLILFIGSLYRIYKIAMRKKRQISYK